MMKFITRGTEEIALLLARYGTVPMKVTCTLPFTEVERALSARETRRTFGRSSRYRIEYATYFRTLAEATEFRLGLLRLREQALAVPLWNDGVKLASAAASGAVSLGKTAEWNPVRFGAEWILLNEDASTYEIVTVSGVSDTALTLLAGTTLSWPAGTMAYPLLFGRFEERPSVEAITPGNAQNGTALAKAELKIIEDSPYERRLVTLPVALPTPGASMPEFASTPMLTLEPAFAELKETTEIDIVYEAIGFLRQEQRQFYPQPVRRGLEMEFVCRTRAQIAQLERLFTFLRATTDPLLVPTFCNDLALTQDLPIAGFPKRITIVNDSVFSDPDYATTHPSWPFLALVENASEPGIANVFPQRLTMVDGGTLTATANITQAHGMLAARLSHLLLCRFADAEIDWEYAKPWRASCRVKFAELPDEYATPQPVIPESAYLYRYYQKLPPGELTLGRYTSYENAIGYAGASYAIAPFSHDAIERTLNLEDKTEITSWGGDFPGNPLGKFMPFTLESDLWLEITEVNAAAPNDGTAESMFVGIVNKPKMNGSNWTATVDLSRLTSGKFPRKVLQKSDNYVPFSRPSGLNADDYNDLGMVSALDGYTVDVAGGSTLSGRGENYYAGGFAELVSHYEGRWILHSTPIAGGQRLVLDRPLSEAVAGTDTIDLFPGYDGSLETQLAKFPDATFGGYPFIPDLGPQIKAAEAKQASGGKKG